MRERQDEVTNLITGTSEIYKDDKNFAQIIDYEQFKKVLIRIATLAASD